MPKVSKTQTKNEKNLMKARNESEEVSRWKKKCAKKDNEIRKVGRKLLRIEVIIEKTTEQKDFEANQKRVVEGKIESAQVLIKELEERMKQDLQDKTKLEEEFGDEKKRLEEDNRLIEEQLNAGKQLILLKNMKKTTAVPRLKPQNRQKFKANRVITAKSSLFFSSTISTYRKNKCAEEVVISLIDKCEKNENDCVDLLRRIMKTSQRFLKSFRIALTDEETLLFRSVIHISDESVKKMKAFFRKKLGFEVLGSRLAVSSLRKDHSVTSNYRFDIEESTKTFPDGRTTVIRSGTATIIDLKKAISERLCRLSKSGKLIFDRYTKGRIVVCLMGDKGSDETKLCLSIANLESPNSPKGLLLLVVYEGQDNYAELSKYVSEVFEQFNQLTSIEYEENGQIVQRPIHKTVVGDFKFLSAILGHAGASASNPCVFCAESWSYKGKGKLTLSKADFSKVTVCRTHKELLQDSASKKNGVVQKPLVNINAEDVIIPTFHAIQGLFGKFGEQYILGSLNEMDRNDGKKGNNLKDQKKELIALEKEERTARHKITVLHQASQEAMCAATAYDIIERNAVLHLKHPNRLCHATLCITNHMKNNSDMWVQCDVCKKDLHTFCSSTFCPDAKEQLALPKVTFECDICKKKSIQQQKCDAWLEMKRLDDEKKEAEQQCCILEQRRTHLEEILKKSAGAKKQEYEKILISIGCDTRTWYQSMTGNQVRKVLRKENIDLIMALLPDTKKNADVKEALYCLSDLMSASCNKTFNDDQIDEIEAILRSFLIASKQAFPTESITPKLHALAFHLIPFLRRHKSWGRLSEQGMEHLHSQYNDLKIRFAPVKNVESRTRLIVQEIGLNNYLFDQGYLD